MYIRAIFWVIVLVSILLLWKVFRPKNKQMATSKWVQVQNNLKDHPVWAVLLFIGLCVGLAGNFLGGVSAINQILDRWLPEPDQVIFQKDSLAGPNTIGTLDKDLHLGGVLATDGHALTIRAKNLTIDRERGLIITSFFKSRTDVPPKPPPSPAGANGGSGTGDDGGDGRAGLPGVNGQPGRSAALVSFEVAKTWRGHLSFQNIGLPGQPGGEGGDGGDGGNGGQGRPSRDGVGIGSVGDCEAGPGRGGNGGSGGAAGRGGHGGEGGHGGVVSIRFGRFAEGSLTINTAGGQGGEGGPPGLPGYGGEAGAEGRLSKYCTSDGRVGSRGSPGTIGPPGVTGPAGKLGLITLTHVSSPKQIRQVQVVGYLNTDGKSIENLAWESLTNTQNP